MDDPLAVEKREGIRDLAGIDPSIFRDQVPDQSLDRAGAEPLLAIAALLTGIVALRIQARRRNSARLTRPT